MAGWAKQLDVRQSDLARVATPRFAIFNHTATRQTQSVTDEPTWA
jgi:hypothetical protein